MAAVLAFSYSFTEGNVTAQTDGFRPLFDGESLDGWVQRGGVAEYAVEDGMIVGTSVPRTGNSFLCTERDYADFVLEFDYKVDSPLNSGVQIRSTVYDEETTIVVNGRERKMRPNVVHGYQVEIDPSDRAWSAGIYDESRRGWLYNLQNNPDARAAFKKDDWNHYRILCWGQTIQTWINGVPAANLRDGLTREGLIGLQVHGVGNDESKVGKQVRWKNIRIREFDSNKVAVYVGTYTREDSQGIYRCVLDKETGELSEPRLVAEATNPSFVAIHPNHRYLYAVSEIGSIDGKPTGGVSAYTINDKDGSLTLLNQQASGGAGPCHLIVDPTGKNVLVANYGGGSISCLPIQDDGSLAEASTFVQHEGSSVNERRQAGPHAHSINVDPNNQFAFVADLGMDKVMIYRFDPDTGSLEANDPPFVEIPPGGGPRHFSFHPSGKFAYTNNEMTSAVTAMKFDPNTGGLVAMDTISTLPEGFDGNNSTAEVLVHPNGRFLYCSNRGHNSVAIFSIDGENGSLKFLGTRSTEGEVPRNFAIDPSGEFLIAENQASSNVVVFRIDDETGMLEPTNSEVKIGNPVCVRFLPLAAE